MLNAVRVVLQGTLLAQLIAVASIPLIARTYSPTEFGKFQVFFSSIILFLPLAAFRLEYALLRMRSANNIPILLGLCIAINVFVAALLAAGVGFVPLFAGTLVQSWAFPIALIAAGSLQTFSYLPLRDSDFSSVSRSKVIQSGAFNVGAVSVGLLMPGASAISLAVCDLLSRAIASGTLLRRWLASHPFQRPRRVLLVVSRMVWTYRDYPLYSVPSSLVSAFGQVLPIFALSVMFSNEIAGQFGMAWRIGLMPIGMIGFSISRVVSAMVSDRLREGGPDLRPALIRLTIVLFTIALPVGIIVLIWGQVAATVILGAEWFAAGTILTVLVPMMIVSFMTGPIVTVLFVTGNQRLHLIWEVLRLLFVSVGWAVCQTAGFDATTSIEVYGVIMAAMGLAYLALVFRKLGTRTSGRLQREGDAHHPE